MAQEATAPRWSPAGPQELPKAPACPLGPPESSDTGHTLEGGRLPSSRQISWLPHPQALGPGRAGAGWFGRRGCGHVSGLPPWPLSPRLSQSCSPSSSGGKFWELLSLVSVSFYFSYFLILFSFCFHSASLPLSLDSYVLQCCPPCPPPYPAYAAAGFQGAHLGCRPCDPQFSLRASCPTVLPGPGARWQSSKPPLASPQGLTSWSGSATGLPPGEGGGGWSPAIWGGPARGKCTGGFAAAGLGPWGLLTTHSTPAPHPQARLFLWQRKHNTPHPPFFVSHFFMSSAQPRGRVRIQKQHIQGHPGFEALFHYRMTQGR